MPQSVNEKLERIEEMLEAILRHQLVNRSWQAETSAALKDMQAVLGQLSDTGGGASAAELQQFSGRLADVTARVEGFDANLTGAAPPTGGADKPQSTPPAKGG